MLIKEKNNHYDCKFILILFCQTMKMFQTVPSLVSRQRGENYEYGKCSKILNTFLFLFSNRMLVISARSHKMFVRIANWEDPDQTASSEAV